MKKISKKDMDKMKLQMGITSVKHDRPSVGRSTVFVGTTSKSRRRDGKRLIRDYAD